MSDGIGGRTVEELDENMSAQELVLWMKEYALRADEVKKARKRKD